MTGTDARFINTFVWRWHERWECCVSRNMLVSFVVQLNNRKREENKCDRYIFKEWLCVNEVVMVRSWKSLFVRFCVLLCFLFFVVFSSNDQPNHTVVKLIDWLCTQCALSTEAQYSYGKLLDVEIYCRNKLPDSSEIAHLGQIIGVPVNRYMYMKQE